MINTPPNDRILGINIYDCLIKHYNTLIFNKRTIHSIVKHKLLMVKELNIYIKMKCLVIKEIKSYRCYFILRTKK